MCLPGDELPQEDWLNQIQFDKIVHFGCFALLTVLFFYPFYRPGYRKVEPSQALAWIVGLAIAWGLITELIQYLFVPGRSFDPWDWVFDSLGTLAARVFCLRRLRNQGKITVNKS